jgi:hypothetical protein
MGWLQKKLYKRLRRLFVVLDLYHEVHIEEQEERDGLSMWIPWINFRWNHPKMTTEHSLLEWNEEDGPYVAIARRRWVENPFYGLRSLLYECKRITNGIKQRGTISIDFTEEMMTYITSVLHVYALPPQIEFVQTSGTTIVIDSRFFRQLKRTLFPHLQK